MFLRRAGRGDDAGTIARDWALMAALTFFFSFGFAVYGGVFQNFFREIVRGDELGLGLLESFREIPGLLAALMAGTLVALAESRVAALGLIVTGVGIGLTGGTDRFWTLVAISVFWSVGFHLWSTVQPAMILTLSKGHGGGRHLGRMRSVGAMATILALAISFGAARLLGWLPYSVYFGIGGASIVISGLLCFGLSHHASGGKRQRLVVRREYGLFYLLMFLEGCRRQVFGIFALFTLIMVYGTSKETVLLLSFLNAIVATATSPWIGRFIDRVGEKLPLSLYAIGLVAIFIGYATIPSVLWLYGLFMMDNLLFGFSLGLNTYLQRIARPGDLTPCLAMGTTMNHIAAVSLPLIGAIVWKQSGMYQLPFVLGAILAFAAFVATRRLPDGVRAEAAA